MRGTMLWFNEVKDFGMILTEDEERLSVHGSAFAGGTRPVSRCAETVVSFDVTGTAGARTATEVVFVPAESHGRARPRRRSFRLAN
jgi:cold shock CspA family protein